MIEAGVLGIMVKALETSHGNPDFQKQAMKTMVLLAKRGTTCPCQTDLCAVPAQYKGILAIHCIMATNEMKKDPLVVLPENVMKAVQKLEKIAAKAQNPNHQHKHKEKQKLDPTQQAGDVQVMDSPILRRAEEIQSPPEAKAAGESTAVEGISKQKEKGTKNTKKKIKVTEEESPAKKQVQTLFQNAE